MFCCRKGEGESDDAPYKPSAAAKTATGGSGSSPKRSKKETVVVAVADIREERGRLPQVDALSTIEEKSIVDSAISIEDTSHPCSSEEPHSSIVHEAEQGADETGTD